VLKKILGGICLLLGLSIVIFFPSEKEYQPEEMSISGVVIGIALIGIGLYLLLS